jgi:hypothetical protein
MKRKMKMKKMMMFAAALVVAVAAQAASIDWSVAANSWYMSDGTSRASKGTAVYLIDMAQLSSIESAIENGATSFKAGDDGIIAVGTTSNTKGYVAKSTATSDKLVAGKEYDFAYLVFDGEQYFVSGATKIAAYDLTDEQYNEANAISFNANSYNNSASKWQATPEPTSALLLVLGGALLALRRKRA